MGSDRRRVLVAGAVALSQAPVPWVLPLVAHVGVELVMGGLGLVLLAGQVFGPLLLIDPLASPSRRRAGILLLGLGGLVMSLQCWVLASALRQGTLYPWVSLCLWLWAWIPWALWTAGLALTRSSRLAAAIALLLASTYPATAISLLCSEPPARPATLSSLLAAWRQPEEQRMEQYLAWAAAGDVERLWEAGTEDYRQRDCLWDPSGCPALPSLPSGVRLQTRMSCSALWDRCTWIRTDRYARPPLEDSEVLLDWSIQTDLQGRFAGISVLGVQEEDLFRRLPPYPDMERWMVALLRSLGAGVLLWGGLSVSLRLGRPRGSEA